jgi:UDP-N-acetyl-D-mannosaminuronic acid dehydrogenase
LGYIGLPTASTFATHGLKVTGVDTNPKIVNGLNNGQLHLFEPGLRTLVQAAIQSGNLVVREKPEPADAFIIAVPTPFKEDKKADLDFVIAASESIVPVLKSGNLVILESTSPPRTTQDFLAPILEKSGLKAGVDFHLAYSPERVLPGKILSELIENARVIGGLNPASAQAGKDLYSIFVRGDIFLTDATTAEMVKLMENTYRDINIAAANEFARLAQEFQVNVWEAISLANLHPRVEILKPGPGVGGHCISVDPWFLVESAPATAHLIATARRVNDSQPAFTVMQISNILGGLKNRNLAILGLAYKPDVDDLRESPAIEVVHQISKQGGSVTVFEPFNKEWTSNNVTSAASLSQAVEHADAIILLVGHKEFRQINPNKVRDMTAATIVFDAVNAWNPSDWDSAGFEYHRLGDGKNTA